MSLSQYKAYYTDFDSNTYQLSLRKATHTTTLNNAVSTLSLETQDTITNLGLMTVEFKEDSTTLFKGIINNQKVKYYTPSLDVHNIDCFDYLNFANKRLVAEIYTEATGPHNLQDVLEDILGDYFPEVTTNNLKSFTSSIDTIFFNYEPLFNCIKKIADMVNANFYIDGSLDFHFFIGNEGTVITNYTTSNIIPTSFELEYISTELVNKIWVLGAKQISTTELEQVFNYDGENRVFSLGYVPNNVTAEKWNGSAWVSADIKEEKDDDELQDFLYNKDEKNVTIPDNITPIPSTNKFKIIYKPTVEIIDYYEDLDSQDTYGIYEKAIKSKDIKSKSEARKIARTELQKNSISLALIKFSTYDVGSSLKVGRLINITLSRYNLNGSFLVLELTKEYDINNGSVKATITAKGVL